MRYKWIYMLLGVVSWMSCNDDSETLTPTTEPEFWYSVPQGSHDYDAKIVDWHERCGFYILYKFEPKDVYFYLDYEWEEVYTDTTYQEKRYTLGRDAFQEGEQIYLNETGEYYSIGEYFMDGLKQKCVIEGNTVIIGKESVTYRGLWVEQADEDYVGKQLVWIEEMFLNFYPDSILSQTLPIKIIMGKNLSISNGKYAYTTNYNSLMFNYGDESIDALSLSQKLSTKKSIHRWFIIDQLFKKIYSIMEKSEFFDFTDYTLWTQRPVPTNSNLYSLGVLNCYSSSKVEYNSNVGIIKENDLKNYLYMIINNSSEKLNKVPANGNYSSTNCEGILNEKKDKNGLIVTKYTILVEKLKEMGIDIQSIGNLYN